MEFAHFPCVQEGGSYRFIADLRGVNEQLLDDNYPLNNINHMLDEINGDTIFSTFDFSQSFFQVPYDKDSRKYSAFTYKGRRYQFCTMTMGNKTSSAHFTRMMNKLMYLVPIEHLVYFIDDLLLSTILVSQHIRGLGIMLFRLRKAGLKLKPSKCLLFKK